MTRLIHIATIANDLPMYRQMRESMLSVGFTENRCRFSLFDNSEENKFDPFQVLRELPATGEEPYVIFCHQDLLFGPETSFEILKARLEELTKVDANWAVAGNAGVSAQGESVFHLNDPNNRWRTTGLPRKVQFLDENFFVMPRTRGTKPSPDLWGFHFYAADLCMTALLERRCSYVIDFPLTHLSAGNTNSQDFLSARERFQQSLSPKLMLAHIVTPSAHFWIDPGGLLGWFALRWPVNRLIMKCGWSVIPKFGWRRRATLGNTKENSSGHSS